MCAQLKQEPAERKPVNLKLTAVKPLGVKWMVKLYDYLKAKPDIIRNGFNEAGIVSCLDDVAELFPNLTI